MVRYKSYYITIVVRYKSFSSHFSSSWCSIEFTSFVYSAFCNLTLASTRKITRYEKKAVLSAVCMQSEYYCVECCLYAKWRLLCWVLSVCKANVTVLSAVCMQSEGYCVECCLYAKRMLLCLVLSVCKAKATVLILFLTS